MMNRLSLRGVDVGSTLARIDVSNDQSTGADVFGKPAADFVDVSDVKKAGGRTWTNRGPLTTIWFYPRATMRELLKTDPTYLVIPLAAAYGADRFIGRAITRGLGDRMSTSSILAMAVLFAPLCGIVAMYLFGWIFAWSGRMLGGRGNAQAVRAAIAWGQAPALILLVIQLGLLVDIGPELFRASRPKLGNSPDLKLYYSAMLAIRLFLNGYMLGLMFQCLSEVHRFSIWRALGAVVLGILVFLGPMLILVAVFGALV